jgi:hypothetical protein
MHANARNWPREWKLKEQIPGGRFWLNREGQRPGFSVAPEEDSTPQGKTGVREQ